MTRSLNILMISHHRRLKAHARPHAMAKHLVQRGHEVSLILTSNSARAGIIKSNWDGVRVIETPDLLWGRLRSGWDLWDMLNRVDFLRREESTYNLIHCFETRPATIYPALYYSNCHKIPLVTDWNDWYGRGGLINVNRPGWYRVLFGGLETYYEEAFRARASGVTVISTALAQRAASLGIPTDRICRIPGGSFPTWFQDRTKEECRKHVGLPFTGPILGFTSTDAHLDVEIVFKALAIIAQKHPSVELIITGHVKKSILDLIKACGAESNTHLTGYLPSEELPWFLGCADVFVLPFPDRIYNVGRWPNKLCEYMSLGRPTVSNPVGDVKTVFENHEIGLLADWDPVDFAQKILCLIENPGLADQLGANARHVATTIYDWKILIERLEDFYYSVLDKEGR